MLRQFDLQLFAEGEEKTEDATPRRRRKMREEGKVLQSKEVVSTALLASLFLVLWLLFPYIHEQIEILLRASLTYSAGEEWGTGQVVALLRNSFGRPLLILSPLFVAVWVIGIAATWMQTGIVFGGKSLNPDLKRINPLEGAKRIASLRSLMNLAKSLGKVGILGYVSYSLIAAHWETLPSMMTMSLIDGLHWVSGVIRDLMVRLLAVLAVLSGLDFLFERMEYEKSLRMTRKEVKDEMKDTEGDPQVRGRIRSLQQQMARQRMMTDVAESDVVIVNPTHFAVALKYDFDSMEAPLVTGKGRGLVAQRIREVAEEHGVLIQQRPPLARALYDMAEIGQFVPPDLYRAVAEVLAFVWRVRQGNQGERRRRA